MRLRHDRRRPAGGRGDDRSRRMPAGRADAVRRRVRVADPAHERRLAGEARPLHRRGRQGVLGGQPRRVRGTGRQHLDRAGRARRATGGSSGRGAPRECRRARVPAGPGERHSLFPDQRGHRRRQGRGGAGRRHDRLQGRPPRDPDRPGDRHVQHAGGRDPCGRDVLGGAAHAIRRVLRVPVHGRRHSGGTGMFTASRETHTHRRRMDLPANARVSDRRPGVRGPGRARRRLPHRARRLERRARPRLHRRRGIRRGVRSQRAGKRSARPRSTWARCGAWRRSS